MTETVLVFEVTLDQRNRAWAWATIDEARGYGFARVSWTAPGGGDDLRTRPDGEKWPPGLDWAWGPHSPRLLFTYTARVLPVVVPA